jgi:hypothetical protein
MVWTCFWFYFCVVVLCDLGGGGLSFKWQTLMFLIRIKRTIVNYMEIKTPFIAVLWILRKASKHLNQDNQSLELGPSEVEAGMLTTPGRRSVCHVS